MKRLDAATWLLTVALGALVLATGTACSSGADTQSSGRGTPSTSPAAGRAPATASGAPGAKQGFAPVVASSELVVGPNRFALGIIDQTTGQPLPDALVHFRFFTVQGNQGTLRSEAEGRFIAPARDAGVSGIIQHKHADGSDHPHANVETDVGVYLARTSFDQAGDWGVEATFRAPDGRAGTLTAPFAVQAQPITPAVGTPAPRTRNPTARDVTDLAQISTAIEPVPALYQTSVADAIAAGKPALVAFVTPGYCSTRFCGPTYELVKRLIPAYGERAALIHIEIWKDPVNKVPFEAVAEWRLRSEPYIFVLDRGGMVADKFEGPVSLAELDEALRRVTN